MRGPSNMPALMASRTAIATFQLPPGSQIAVTPERSTCPACHMARIARYSAEA